MCTDIDAKNTTMPDGCHVVTEYTIGSKTHLDIRHSVSGRMKESVSVPSNKQNLIDAFYAAAERKYRKRSAFEHRNTSVKM